MVGGGAREEVRLNRTLIDTNVLLDLVLEREPWLADERDFWQALEDGHIVGCVSAAAVTDVFYIVRRAAGLAAAHAAVQHCLDIFEIIPVDRATLVQAVALPGSDFEDNVQIACATTARVDAIVTRDTTGFQAASVPVLGPANAARQLGPQ